MNFEITNLKKAAVVTGKRGVSGADIQLLKHPSLRLRSASTGLLFVLRTDKISFDASLHSGVGLCTTCRNEGVTS
jgi:hypothetical protein